MSILSVSIFWRRSESTAVTLKETIQANLTLWGNGYGRIFFDYADRPRHIFPLPSGKVFMERFAGELRYCVEGGGGRFAPEEIIHIPGLSLNGSNGMSPIAYAREAIAMGKATEIFGATFFGNGAQVGGVLEVPAILKPEQQAQLKESWNAAHAGVGNAHGTAVLMAGTKYNKIGIPPEEAQFLETRVFQLREIARIYRIPPHMLGDLERATNANIEQMSLEFLIYTLAPWLEKWEQELTRKLCGQGFHVRFDERRLLRGDLAARQAYYAAARQGGYLSINEIRREEGKAPIADGGDVYLSPLNMVSADKAKDLIPGQGLKTPAVPAVETKENAAARESIGELVSGAVAVRDLFADGVLRMLKKEHNAAGRGKADEGFYETHRGHVRECLMPGAKVFLALLGKLRSGLERFAPMNLAVSFSAAFSSDPPIPRTPAPQLALATWHHSIHEASSQSARSVRDTR